jgi:hypothetical protein
MIINFGHGTITSTASEFHDGMMVPFTLLIIIRSLPCTE